MAVGPCSRYARRASDSTSSMSEGVILLQVDVGRISIVRIVDLVLSTDGSIVAYNGVIAMRL